MLQLNYYVQMQSNVRSVTGIVTPRWVPKAKWRRRTAVSSYTHPATGSGNGVPSVTKGRCSRPEQNRNQTRFARAPEVPGVASLGALYVLDYTQYV